MDFLLDFLDFLFPPPVAFIFFAPVDIDFTPALSLASASAAAALTRLRPCRGSSPTLQDKSIIIVSVYPVSSNCFSISLRRNSIFSFFKSLLVIGPTGSWDKDACGQCVFPNKIIVLSCGLISSDTSSSRLIKYVLSI